jgi:hypothetical protein
VSDVEIRRNEIIELLYTYKNIASMILRNGSASLAAQSIMILFTLWTFTKLTRSPVRMEEFLLYRPQTQFSYSILKTDRN